MAHISKRIKAMAGAVEAGKLYPVDAAVRTIAGSARSMGLVVEG